MPTMSYKPAWSPAFRRLLVTFKMAASVEFAAFLFVKRRPICLITVLCCHGITLCCDRIGLCCLSKGSCRHRITLCCDGIGLCHPKMTSKQAKTDRNSHVPIRLYLTKACVYRYSELCGNKSRKERGAGTAILLVRTGSSMK